MQLSIFILAAGLGERLRPITNHIPKPLIPVLGKPVLESVLEKVSALPVDTIGINLQHKKIMIENWIKQSAYSNRAKTRRSAWFIEIYIKQIYYRKRDRIYNRPDEDDY